MADDSADAAALTHLADKLKLQHVDPHELTPHPDNYRKHPADQIDHIKASLRELGQYKNVVIRPDGTILAGHGVVQAACELGMDRLAVYVFEGGEAEERLLMVADNEVSRIAEDDEARLHTLLQELASDFGDLVGTGWSEAEHEARLAELAEQQGALLDGDALSKPTGALAERFGIPPFSVLDARQGYWQQRKRAWLALGIRSELGRGGTC